MSIAMRTQVQDEGGWVELPSAPGELTDLSVGSDGTLAVATSMGLYLWIDSSWELIAPPDRAPFTSVSVGDCMHVMAVMSGTTIHYLRRGTTWEGQIFFVGEFVRAVSTTDKGVVYALADPGNSLMLYHSTSTYTKTGLTQYGGISAAEYDLVYGTLDADADPEPRAVEVKVWAQTLVTTGLTQISAAYDGSIWGVNGMGLIQRTNRAENPMVWIPVKGPALEKVSVGSRLQVVGHAAGRIYRYQPFGTAPIPLIEFAEPDFEEMYMAGSFASWAYELQPLESTWLGSPGRGVEQALAGSSWKVQNYYNDTGTSTQAFMAYSVERREIVLAFRGTQEPLDWYYDLTWYAYPVAVTVSSTVMVAMPVLLGWSNIREAVIADLKAAVEAVGGPSAVKTVYVTGHSLGAALATYAAYDLVSTKQLAGVSPQAMTVFSFASPPVGNLAFAESYESLGIRTYRVLISNDPIIAAAEYLKLYQGYQHVGKMQVALPPGSFLFSHFMTTYQSLMAKASALVAVFFGGFDRYPRAGPAPAPPAGAPHPEREDA